MTDKQKKAIDEMTYEQMLSKWRFAPIGDPMFQGEVGDYFSKVMKQKRENHSQVSKKIGWD